MNQAWRTYLVGEKNVERFYVQMYYFMVVDEVHSYNYYCELVMITFWLLFVLYHEINER